MQNESIRYLIVPGWQGSGAEHWQTHWQDSLPNSARVEQMDWFNPRRDDWVGQLQRSIADQDTPVILIAHSLGCITVAHWARLAPLQSLRQVQGALLVAPADVERPNCAPVLRNFGPIPQDLLPFPTQIVTSDNDAAVSTARAMEMARNWGADIGVLSEAGHINVKSGHRRWEQGFAYLYRLQSRMEHSARRRA